MISTGFNLWTSAHGFHHLELTKNSFWRIFWMIILAICSISLICLVIYYFYYVFTFSVYSRLLLQDPATFPWPTTIICDRQVAKGRLCLDTDCSKMLIVPDRKFEEVFCL